MDYDLNKFFNYSLDLLCIAGTDGYFKRVNPSFERVLGWTKDQFLERPFVDFIHPEDVEATVREVEKLASGKPTISFENRYRCRDGSYRHLRWTAYPEKESGLLFAVARDVTELKEADERFRLGLDASPSAMIMTDEHGSITLVNEETERLFGYSRDDLVGKPVDMLVPRTYRQRHRYLRTQFYQEPAARPMGTGRDLLARCEDGEEFPVEIGLSPIWIRGDLFVISSIIDLRTRREAENKIIELAREVERANARLLELATTDMLTDLKNRRAFEQQLESQLMLAQRSSGIISLLMLDVDHFKKYNDEHGHIQGDQVLQTLAVLLTDNARGSDLVARFGGEEFAVILPDTDSEGAIFAGERLRQAVCEYHWNPQGVTISVGAATLSFHENRSAPGMDYGVNLIEAADRALYFSKEQGRNRVTHDRDLPVQD